MPESDEGSTVGDYQVRGARGDQCRYGQCESEATTLVQFNETAPVLQIWFCGPHAGNSIKKHDDAHTVTEEADAE